MSSTRKNSKNCRLDHELPSGAVARDLECEADVLFQRIYDKWYAFTVVDDDCLMTQVSEEEVMKRMGRKAPRAS